MSSVKEISFQFAINGSKLIHCEANMKSLQCMHAKYVLKCTSS